MAKAEKAEKHVEMLPVKLTGREISDYALKLSVLCTERTAARVDYRAVRAKWRAKIGDLETEIDRLAAAVDSKEEMRPTQHSLFDSNGGTKLKKRLTRAERENAELGVDGSGAEAE